MNPGITKLVFALLCLTTLTTAFAAQTTALDDYIAAPDASYSYQIPSPYISPLYSSYVLQMTSQSWRDSSQVDTVQWKHWVRIFVPAGTPNSTAMILINGGSHLDPAPLATDQYGLIAYFTNSVIVELSAVPNQPLQFADESFQRTEDEIIAYSWEKYLDGGDDFWPVQLPMVKSVVRCMDAVQDITGVDNFLLTGGSKRGWAAWLTAAVDSRVIAVAPVLIDLLNMKRSFAHHWASYGFWAEALAPYQDSRIFERFDEPRATQLLEIVDPFAYRNRLTIPKFIINASGDDFFIMDSLQFYIDDLAGETHVRIMPNADHYMSDGKLQEALEGAVPYYYDLLNNTPRPQYSWNILADGSIRIETQTDDLKEVVLFQAHNPDTRDFRLTTTGASWTASPLTTESPGVYIASVPTPPQGWTAFFVELTYDSAFARLPLMGPAYDYRFTSEIHVLPQQRPFETDFSRDRKTDLEDLMMLSDAWLTENPYRDILPRRSGDGVIDMRELAIFAQNWLKSL